jgi:hypothetical protein
MSGIHHQKARLCRTQSRTLHRCMLATKDSRERQQTPELIVHRGGNRAIVGIVIRRRPAGAIDQPSCWTREAGFALRITWLSISALVLHDSLAGSRGALRDGPCATGGICWTAVIHGSALCATFDPGLDTARPRRASLLRHRGRRASGRGRGRATRRRSPRGWRRGPRARAWGGIAHIRAQDLATRAVIGPNGLTSHTRAGRLHPVIGPRAARGCRGRRRGTAARAARRIPFIIAAIAPAAIVRGLVIPGMATPITGLKPRGAGAGRRTRGGRRGRRDLRTGVQIARIAVHGRVIAPTGLGPAEGTTTAIGGGRRIPAGWGHVAAAIGDR